MRVTEEQLNHRIRELEIIISNKKNALKSAPEGGMSAFCRNGKVQCYWHRRGIAKDIYIRDASLIRALAQKEYDSKVLDAAEKELAFLKHILLNIPSDIPEESLSRMVSAKQQFVNPDYLTDELFLQKWLSEQYMSKGFRDGTPDYYSMRGERVRSKSEVMIANCLYQRGIAYKYECPLQLKGEGIFYPDFRILNIRTRKEYIHEHFGMIDDKDYADSAVRKINTYMHHGIFPGDKLITTFESRANPLSTRTVNEIIDRYYV